MQLLMVETAPAESSEFTGTVFSSDYGTPYVNASDRSDYLEGVSGTTVYESRPGVPNPLDIQGDAVGATVDVGGWSGMPQVSWYDSERPNAGFPLPIVSDTGPASEMNPYTDLSAMAGNYDFGIDDYVRFEQPELVAPGSRITERTLDVPVEWKAQPTFPATPQKVRPWDRVLGAWPWTGTKDAVTQPVASTPLYFDRPLPDGIPSMTGAANAMIPNTVSLSPYPLTYRLLPQQWDNDYINSGV